MYTSPLYIVINMLYTKLRSIIIQILSIVLYLYENNSSISHNIHHDYSKIVLVPINNNCLQFNTYQNTSIV